VVEKLPGEAEESHEKTSAYGLFSHSNWIPPKCEYGC